MILDFSNEDRYHNEQIDLCYAAYRYMGKLLDTFTEDCVLVALNKTIPKESYHKALTQMVSVGEIVEAGKSADGTPVYRLANK